MSSTNEKRLKARSARHHGTCLVSRQKDREKVALVRFILQQAFVTACLLLAPSRLNLFVPVNHAKYMIGYQLNSSKLLLSF